MIFSACTVTVENEVIEEDAIKAMLYDMWDAIEKEDIERYASHVHPDFTQFGETDPVLRSGKTAEIEGFLTPTRTITLPRPGNHHQYQQQSNGIKDENPFKLFFRVVKFLGFNITDCNQYNPYYHH